MSHNLTSHSLHDSSQRSAANEGEFVDAYKSLIEDEYEEKIGEEFSFDGKHRAHSIRSEPEIESETKGLKNGKDTNEGDITEEFYENGEDPDDMSQGYMVEKNEITVRGMITGCLIGVLLVCMNINFGLRTGWSQGGSIFSSILIIGIFKILGDLSPSVRYETVVSTTVASAAGTMVSAAGLVSSIPALKLLGYDHSLLELYLWALSVAYFGVFFAVPLRRQMIIVEKLRFPSGTVAAFTVKSMIVEAAQTAFKAQLLLITGIGSGLFSLFSFFIPYLEEPPVPDSIKKWGWSIYVSPLLIGGGMLSGLRASGSIFIGSVLGWGIIGPTVHHLGWVEGDIMRFTGMRGWILWVGVSMMLADSAVQILSISISFAWYVIKSIVRRIRKANPKDTEYIQINTQQSSIHRILTPQYIPWYYPVIGLVASTILLCFVGEFIFKIRWYFLLMSIPIGFVMSFVATRCSGETDINPVGGAGKVSQLFFAGVAPREIPTNLLASAVVASGAAQCCDMMQDLKTGYIVKVSPLKQFYAQCIGIVIGIIVSPPVYKLYDTAYFVGGNEIPAPAAHAWKAVAEILARGVDGLPKNLNWGVLCGFIVGCFIAGVSRILTCFPKWGVKFSQIVPSALAIGIGMIVPPKQGLTMFAGALFFQIWKTVHNESAKKYFFTISSGLVAGEGLMGMIVALLKLLGLKPLFEP